MKNFITLAPLPFSRGALEPHMSKETLDYHYGKHHKNYVEKVNHLIEKTEFESCSLEEIIKNSNGALFNNAAQVWNHHFFWKGLTPEQKARPSDSLKNRIEKDFDSLEHFEEVFTQTAVGGFGSGWTWVEREPGGHLVIRWRPGAESSIKEGKAIPLLVCDLWEHAYYIDHRNDRNKFMSQFWKLVNWDFVNSCFDSSDALSYPMSSIQGGTGVGTGMD